MKRAASQAFDQWRRTAPADRPAWFVADTDVAAVDDWLPAEAWHKAEARPFQFLDGTGDTPQAPTFARLLTQDGLLFLRFECREPDIEHLVYAHTGRDSATLWRDDVVEVFLQPEEDGPLYHMVFNPAGARSDAVRKAGTRADASWDPPLRSRAVIGQNGWTLDVALPLAACAATGTPISPAPPVWRANLARVRQGREGAFAEDTGWCATGSLDAGAPAHFGLLYLEANERPPATRVAPGAKQGRPRASPAEIADALRGRFRRPAVTVDAATNAAGSFQLIPRFATFSGACEATDVDVRREADGLRLRVRCAERDLRTIVTQTRSDGASVGGDDGVDVSGDGRLRQAPHHGAGIWNDDCVEVFLAPGRRESFDYLQSIVNAAGSLYVARGHKPAGSTDVRATVAIETDAWTVDLRIPFSVFGLRPGRIPALWGLNVTRNRPARPGAAGQATTWSRFPWSAHDPGAFGTLWLAEADLFPDLGDAAALEAATQQGREIAARCATEARGLHGGALLVAEADVFSAAERSKQALPDTVERHLCGLRDQLLAARDKEWDAVKTPEDARRLQARIRNDFLRAVGGLPAQRCPLNPRLSVVFENDELRIERLIYESRPRFFVTANVFVPKRRGTRRLPVVLRLVGHAMSGRFGALAFCEALARDGYLAMTIDLTGQGERIYVNNGLGSRTPTSNHYAEGAACFLTGGNLAGYMIYDAMRAIDYLETRDEADMRRVVLTGESGGGTMTEYVAALDGRLFAAAPVSSGGSARQATGNYDSEQVLAGSFAGALDIEGFGVLAAPRPYCVIAEAGEAYRRKTQRSFEIARRIFVLLAGTPEAGARLQYVPTAATHGYCKTHYDLFRNWLGQTMPPDPDGPRVVGQAAFDHDTCRASRSGRAFYSRDLPERETTLTLNAQRIALAGAFDLSVTTRAAATERATRLRGTLRDLLAMGDGPPTALAVESRGVVTHGDVTVEKLVLQTDPGVFVPAVLLASRTAPPAGPAVVWISRRGKRGVLAMRADALRAALAAGTRILLPDLRGTGETTGDPDTTYMGGDASLNCMSIQLGRPLIGLRVRDALCCVAWLRERGEIDASRIGLLGDSPSNPNPPRIRQPRLITDAGLEVLTQAESLGPVVALLAFVLDTNVAHCATCGLPESYAGMCRTPYVYHPFEIFVPGILQTGDIADLCAAAAPRPLLLAGNVNACNQRLDQTGEDATAFERARRAYALQDAASRLTIEPAGDILRAAAFRAE